MTLIQDIMTAAFNMPKQYQALVNTFLNNDKSHTRYLVGKNDQSKELIELVKIDGIIDDYSNNTHWNNIPIVSGKNFGNNPIVVNCSTSISPVLVYQNLIKLGIKNILNIYDLIETDVSILKLPWFVEDMRKDYYSNINQWEKLYSLLKDEESRQTLVDVMRFRLTANPVFMENYSVRLDDQYMEAFMQYNNECFVDAGGFDGDTTNQFCKRYSNYKKIFFFEPVAENMSKAKQRLKGFSNIEYHIKGLSNKKDNLFISATGSSSTINHFGEIEIEVASLDSIVKEPVSFIKMDIEGWELKALAGCAAQIKMNSPKLAIAVYHNAGDFWRIPVYVLSLNSDYNIFLRHYTQGWSETVMYFVPNKSLHP